MTKKVRLALYNIVGLFALSQLVQLSYARSQAWPRNAIVVVGDPLVLPLLHEGATIDTWAFEKFTSKEGDIYIYSKELSQIAPGFNFDGQGDEHSALRRDSVTFEDAGKYTAGLSYSNGQSSANFAILVNVIERPSCNSTMCSIIYSGRIVPKLSIVPPDSAQFSLNDDMAGDYESKITCNKSEPEFSEAVNATLTTVTCTSNHGLSCSDCVCIVKWPPIKKMTVSRLKLIDSKVYEGSYLNCSMNGRDREQTSAAPCDCGTVRSTPVNNTHDDGIGVCLSGLTLTCKFNTELWICLCITLMLIFTAGFFTGYFLIWCKNRKTVVNGNIPLADSDKEESENLNSNQSKNLNNNQAVDPKSSQRERKRNATIAKSQKRLK